MNILEQFLMHYEGCLLLVSHDRYFMDKCADTLFILEDDGSVSGFVGKCSEYVEYREMLRKEAKDGESLPLGGTSLPPTPSNGGSAPVTPPSKSEAAPSQKKKLSFKEQREFEQLDAEIPALEAEQKSLEEQMASSDFETARTAGDRYKEISAILETKYARWEELAALA